MYPHINLMFPHGTGYYKIKLFLSNLIITAKDGYLKLCSTNLDIYCSDQVVADVVSPGEISVSASTFHEIIKRLPNGSDLNGTLDEESSSLILKCGRSKFNLTTMTTDDFPTIADSDLDTKFVLSATELIRMIDKTKLGF